MKRIGRRRAEAAHRRARVAAVLKKLDLPDGPMDLDHVVRRTSALVGAEIVVKRVPHHPDRPTGLWYTNRVTGRRLLAISESLPPVLARHVVLHELFHMLVRLLEGDGQRPSRPFPAPPGLEQAVATGTLRLEGARAYCCEDDDEEALVEQLALLAALRAEQFEAPALPPTVDEIGLDGLIKSLGYGQ
jgi:hypothetical protein